MNYSDVPKGVEKFSFLNLFWPRKKLNIKVIGMLYVRTFWGTIKSLTSQKSTKGRAE